MRRTNAVARDAGGTITYNTLNTSSQLRTSWRKESVALVPDLINPFFKSLRNIWKKKEKS